MADKMRWRYGETNPIMAPPRAESNIEIGDLLWWDGSTKTARPACECGLSFVREQNFPNAFLGVAMQRSPVDDLTSIRVATTGVFEFDCDPQTFEFGTYIGPVRNHDTQVLDSQRVMNTTDRQRAIAHVVKREPVAVSTVLGAIRSNVICGV